MIVVRSNIVEHLRSVGETQSATIVEKLFGEAAVRDVYLAGYRSEFGSLLEFQKSNRVAREA